MIIKLMNMAEKAIADSGTVIPMFLTVNGKGDIVPENPLTSATLGKMIVNAVKGKVPMMLPLFKGNVAIFMSESPEKEETVIIHIQTKNELTTAIGRIETKDGKKNISEWTITRDCEYAGAIPEILKKCVT